MKKAGTIKYNPEYSTMNAAEQNLTKTNRKVTRNLKYVANHARVQLPSAGTGLSSPSAAGEEGSGETRTNVFVLAPGEACGTGQPHTNRRVVAVWSARRVHAPEVAGSNPAPASREASITIKNWSIKPKSPLVSRVDGKEAGRWGGSVTRNTGYTRMGVQIPPASIHLASG